MLVGQYPLSRPRRNRLTQNIRDLVAETKLSADDLLYPIFIQEGKGLKTEIKTLPGQFRYSIDELIKFLPKLIKLKIKAIAVFPVITSDKKTADAKEALNKDNIICQAIRKIKNIFPDLIVISDIALDPYTNHGHDGIVVNGDVDNNKTTEVLCKQAVLQAECGADVVAPSDMMDGRIKKIRKYLDKNNFKNILILSYAAKYASNLYGPFRDALDNKNEKISKKTYQMDFRNKKEALKEIKMDIAEGADILMVKPALPYLDIISEAEKISTIPIFAYQVSGEYSMLKLAAEKNILDYEQAMLENLVAIKRAGASAIFTYAALEIAEFLKKENGI